VVDVVYASKLSFFSFGRSIKGIKDEQVDSRWYVSASREGRDQLGGGQDWDRRADNIASDIMFTNKLFSRFFNNGQVIDTIRGGGIFQSAVDKAIKLLEDGEWVCLVKGYG
jgi:hypothetical protein